MTQPDDRIVLPLSLVREAAERLCQWCCSRRIGATEHDDYCLIPALEQRDALMRDTRAEQVSPDCKDRFKHNACPGCLCDCHRHSHRTT